MIGKVVHYYDKLGVAIIKLEKDLKVGDKVKFTHDENSFEQTIDSMQIEHQQLKTGEKGAEVGVKVDQEAKVGTLVYPAQ